MIRNRKGSAMMLNIFICILLVSAMLIAMSNSLEASIRYAKSNSNAINLIIDDRNRNEKIYTEVYRFINNAVDNDEIIENLKHFNYLDLKYESGPIVIDENKTEFVFIDSYEKNYRFVIETSIDSNQINLYRIH